MKGKALQLIITAAHTMKKEMRIAVECATNRGEPRGRPPKVKISCNDEQAFTAQRQRITKS